MRIWSRIVLTLLSLSLVADIGRAQEGSATVPPWGEGLDHSEPESERGPRLHRLFEVREDGEPGPMMWVTPEYVLSYIHSSRLPPLITSGPTTDARPGALGNPLTKIQYGNEPLDYQDRHGFRIAIGGVVSEEHALTMEASYLTLNGRTQGSQGSSPGNPIIARPFYDVVNNASDSSLTTYPGFLAGSISVQSTSYLQAAELNAFAGAWQTEKLRVRGLVGLRHLRLRESLAIGEASTVTDMGNPLFGQTVNVNDSFETTNNFFGGQVGASAEYRWRRWTGEIFGKVALGMLEERVSIDGSTSFMGAQTPGGLLALSSNIGSSTRNRFAAIPEAGFKLQAAINRHWNLHVGYSFLYVGDVVRPGSQVDLGVNPNLVPTSTTFGAGGPARPAFRPQESDYWAHLFTFGFTVQY